MSACLGRGTLRQPFLRTNAMPHPFDVDRGTAAPHQPGKAEGAHHSSAGFGGRTPKALRSAPIVAAPAMASFTRGISPRYRTGSEPCISYLRHVGRRSHPSDVAILSLPSAVQDGDTHLRLFHDAVLMAVDGAGANSCVGPPTIRGSRLPSERDPLACRLGSMSRALPFFARSSGQARRMNEFHAAAKQPTQRWSPLEKNPFADGRVRDNRAAA